MKNKTIQLYDANTVDHKIREIGQIFFNTTTISFKAENKSFLMQFHYYSERPRDFETSTPHPFTLTTTMNFRMGWDGGYPGGGSYIECQIYDRQERGAYLFIDVDGVRQYCHIYIYTGAQANTIYIFSAEGSEQRICDFNSEEMTNIKVYETCARLWPKGW